MSLQADQLLSKEVQALAREIAGPHANARIQVLALRVAEAQVDLRRVRHLRHQFLTEKLSDPRYASEANVLLWLSKPPQRSDKFATILLQAAESLQKMDRYERRARSRRKFEIRALDDERRRPGTRNIILPASILAKRTQKGGPFQ
jgi:hypothetical protein